MVGNSQLRTAAALGHQEFVMMNSWHPLDVEMTGLKGRRLRVLTDLPTDGQAPVDLPPGTTDVIAVDDDVSVFLTVRVHPVDDPHTAVVVPVRFEQLALYDEQQP